MDERVGERDRVVEELEWQQFETATSVGYGSHTV